MYGEHNVIYSLNAIYQRKWEVSILASGGEHQSISLHQCEWYSAKELTRGLSLVQPNFFLKMVLMQIGQFYNTFQTLLPVIQIIQIWAGVSQRGLFKKTIVFNDLESNIESIWSATTIFRDRKCWMTVAERFRQGKRSGPNIIVVIMNIRQCHFIQQLRSASFQYRTYPFSTELAKVVYSFSRPGNKKKLAYFGRQPFLNAPPKCSWSSPSSY